MFAFTGRSGIIGPIQVKKKTPCPHQLQKEEGVDYVSSSQAEETEMPRAFFNASRRVAGCPSAGGWRWRGRPTGRAFQSFLPPSFWGPWVFATRFCIADYRFLALRLALLLNPELFSRIGVLASRLKRVFQFRSLASRVKTLPYDRLIFRELRSF
jgi:hypothetical protein